MISEQLRRARAYEARMGALISPAERPLFHLTPTTGWLNDPNGFSGYRGEYHLFYQYHPYSTSWGPMHWGHCKSRDLLRWERLPAALAPDQPYDRDGCFSGSAAETPDGRHLLMYTGRRLEEGREVQAQCLAVGNGENYEKLSANPVITGEQLPPGGSAQDFRDPKLWRDGSRWYAVAGNRAGDGSGEVLLYSSEDLERWRLEGALDRSANQWGKMWECPDFFSLDGQSILLVSPQELEAPGPEFHNGQEVLCILGGLDSGVEIHPAEHLACGPGAGFLRAPDRPPAGRAAGHDRMDAGRGGAVLLCPEGTEVVRTAYPAPGAVCPGRAADPKPRS